MERRIPLDQIEVASPCTADWGAMVGDDQKRFCGHCQKHVHNLSAMTRSAAEQVVCQTGTSLCVQYQKDSAGTLITLDYAPVTPRSRWARWGPTAAVMSAISAMLVLAGFSEPGPVPVAGGIKPMTVNTPTTQPAPMMGTPLPATQPIKMIMGDVDMPIRGEMVAPMIKGKVSVAPTTQPEE
ncbi:MAG: hypothetical protein H7144_08485 [Burkholderiales bacterium]|nr:hypothetical protein [Phycisphaerae bacterium]